MTAQHSGHPTWEPLPMSAPLAGGELLWRAPAKLNLTLRVLGRRGDGYHDLDSVVAKVTLYDDLRLRPRRDGQIVLTVSGPHDCGPTETNLVQRAARLLVPPGSAKGADIALTKRIPPGAGLGGGSSDAAGALLALCRLWDLHLAPPELAELAGRLGSDVPLFLGAPAARIAGRGERVEPIVVHPFFAVLFLSGLHCPTAGVYAAFDAGRGSPSAEKSPPLKRGPGTRQGETSTLPVPPESGGGQFGGPPSSWRGALFNDLRPAALAVCPPLAELAGRLATATKMPVGMSGSGSALFILTDTAGEARAVLAGLPEDLRRYGLVIAMNPW